MSCTASLPSVAALRRHLCQNGGAGSGTGEHEAGARVRNRPGERLHQVARARGEREDRQMECNP